ncbi:MAG: hypothetical protein ACRCV9_01570 [Burkholderiaceae bacterium]
MSKPRTEQELLHLIREKKTQVERFLSATRPRKRRLLNATVFGSCIAAVLTAAPAVGGPPLTNWLNQATGTASPAWQLLCGVASVCSVTAAISTQMLKSHNIEDQVIKGQIARAHLETLEAAISLRQINTEAATSQYLQCVQEIAFIDTLSG